MLRFCRTAPTGQQSAQPWAPPRGSDGRAGELRPNGPTVRPAERLARWADGRGAGIPFPWALPRAERTAGPSARRGGTSNLAVGGTGSGTAGELQSPAARHFERSEESPWPLRNFPCVDEILHYAQDDRSSWRWGLPRGPRSGMLKVGPGAVDRPPVRKGRCYLLLGSRSAETVVL
jgi:hypothetical protein